MQFPKVMVGDCDPQRDSAESLVFEELEARCVALLGPKPEFRVGL